MQLLDCLTLLLTIRLRRNVLNFIAIFIGGGIGAILRYILSKICKNFLNFAFCGTFLANIIGCFLIGLVLGIVLKKSDLIPYTLKIFLTVGFLGGLTTFSTFSWEVFEFINSGKITQAMIYLSVSVVMGLCATYLGFILSKQI